MSAHDWFGCERVEAPRADARRSCWPCTPSRTSRSIEALCARGGGAIDADTLAMRGHLRGGAARGRRRRRAGRRAARRGRARRRLRAAPARPPRRARAGDGLLLLQQRRGRGARARSRAHGAERVLILDWDVHHGNGTNEIFHADPSVLFVSIHESPLYPGHGPGVRRRLGRGEGYTVNLPVPGGTGDAGYRSLVEHVAGAADRATSRRSSCSSRPASTPTATTRSRPAGSPRPATRR